MAKKNTSITKVSANLIAVADDQLSALVRVLAPHEKWLSTKTLALAKIGEAAATVVAIRELVDTAEKGRKALTKPLLDEKREIDQLYKPFVEKAVEIGTHIGRLLLVVQAQERARLAREAEKDAKKLEKAGATQAAADVREAAISAPVISGGLGTSTVTRAKVNDLVALCRAIAEGTASVELVEPNMSALNALARAGMELPPGVERVTEEILKRTA